MFTDMFSGNVHYEVSMFSNTIFYIYIYSFIHHCPIGINSRKVLYQNCQVVDVWYTPFDSFLFFSVIKFSFSLISTYFLRVGYGNVFFRGGSNIIAFTDICLNHRLWGTR